MPREIYLYETISDYTAEKINRQIGYADNDDINIRMMTRGGYTPAGIAMLSKIESHKGQVKMSIDGDTSSMGAFMAIFADEVEMSDMAELMFHKASYPTWYEPSQEEKQNLERENKRFKKKMEQRLGDSGSEIIEKIFNKEKREDIYLTASQAKKIGLVNRIIKLDPSQKAAYQESYHKQMLNDKESKTTQTNKLVNKSKSSKMEITTEEFDAKINAAREEGKKEGLVLGKQEGIEEGKKAEQERIQSWNVWSDIDPEAVKVGIDSGKGIDSVTQNEFILKASQKTKIAEHKDDNADDLDTPPKAKTAKQIFEENEEAKLDKIFNS